MADTTKNGPTQNQEVTTSKVVTFFLVPVWCQDLGENGNFGLKNRQEIFTYQQEHPQKSNDEVVRVIYWINCNP